MVDIEDGTVPLDWVPALTALTINKASDPLAKLQALAERLGVSPKATGGPPSVVIETQSGKNYDLFDLMNALLDRCDAAARLPIRP